MQPQIVYRYRVSAHPTLPFVYISIVTYDGHLMCFEHADGYLTLTPQVLFVDPLVSYTPPLPIPKKSQVAIGGASKICLIDIDAQGKFLAKGVQMTVNNPKTS